MKVLKSWESPRSELERLLTRKRVEDVEVSARVMGRTKEIFGEALTPLEVVARILSDVRREGDRAVADYAHKIDRAALTPATFFASPDEFAAARKELALELEGSFGQALKTAKENIRRYHARQLPNSWITTEKDGVILGQKVTPLRRVAVYVPGGSAPLVSSVLMGVIPARVAGVEEVIVATPVGPQGTVNPYLLLAADEAGANAVLKVGGAQAVAALAFGTETIPRVDKIVGPGNIYVTLAKKLAFGQIGVESLAGPSEILVIADETASARFVAADLLSQAEHDPEAGSVLLTTSESLALKVEQEIEKQKKNLSRVGIIDQSLAKSGTILICRDIDEAVEWANFYAPEHLELLVAEPFRLLERIKNAGAIFIGTYSCEPVGDYIAGPNHVLPTNGTARFSSPLGVEDFVKRSSLIAYTKEGLQAVGGHGIRLAEVEGLDAHANAIRIRLEETEVDKDE